MEEGDSSTKQDRCHLLTLLLGSDGIGITAVCWIASCEMFGVRFVGGDAVAIIDAHKYQCTFIINNITITNNNRIHSTTTMHHNAAATVTTALTTTCIHMQSSSPSNNYSICTQCGNFNINDVALSQQQHSSLIIIIALHNSKCNNQSPPCSSSSSTAPRISQHNHQPSMLK